jgi:hypothetical protein
MTTLYQQISESFLTRLSSAKAVDSKMIEQLRMLFADGKKLKTEDLVKIFSGVDAGEIK